MTDSAGSQAAGGAREMEALERMVARARMIAGVLKNFAGNVRLVSHHDSDGVSSAAIMVSALARDGKEFRLSFIRQLYETDIMELGREDNRLIVFLDMGSGQLGLIQEHLARGSTRIIIIDHHMMQGEVTTDDVIQLNPVEFGIDENIAGSGAAYLVARAMSPENRDLSELAVIGAIGDSQTGSIGPGWGLLGINKEILQDAQNTGKIRVSKGLRLWGRRARPIHKALEYSVDPYIPGVSGSESGAVNFLHEIGIDIRDESGAWRTLSSLSEKELKRLATGIIKERIRDNRENPDWIFGDVYDLLDKEEGLSDASEFATVLNSAGKQGMGYVGIGLCLNNKEYFAAVDGMLESYRREIGRSLRWLERNRDSFISTEHAVFIVAGNSIPENVASNVVSIASRSADLLPEADRAKPVFIMVDNERGETKISARASDGLVERGFSLQGVVSVAAAAAGGEGGGHAGAAGASIPKAGVEMFINSIEELMKKVFGIGDKESPKPEKEPPVMEAAHGRAEASGSEEGNGREQGTKGKVKAGIKKDERKGLVRYLGS